MTLSFEQKLQNYADLVVNIGVGLQPGQRLAVRAPIETAPLVRLVTAAAYKAGARLVDVMWTDDALTLARFQHAPRDSFEDFPTWRTRAMLEMAEQGDAFLSVLATDPDLLKDQDPDLVSLAQKTYQTHARPFSKKIMNDEVNWSLVSYPIPAWAAKIFPSDPPEQQMSKLWDLIFQVCRVDLPDPLAAWEEHIKILTAKKEFLNAKQYAALKFSGPGTDFTVGLAQNHRWHSARSTLQNGTQFVCNIPTEEVFTAPHKNKADGVVSSSMPLSYAGVLIEDFSVTFEAGRVVKVAAKKGEDILRKLVETDEGAAQLGEVALVPHNSPISQLGVLFFNTLFDENAASHIALGRAYRFCVENGPTLSDEDFAAAGGNDSLVHVDFMIGSKEMDVDAITVDGTVEPLMRGGEWAE